MISSILSKALPVRATVVIPVTSRPLTQSTVRDLLYDLDSLRLDQDTLHGDTAGDPYTNGPNGVAIPFVVTYSYFTILNPLTGS